MTESPSSRIQSRVSSLNYKHVFSFPTRGFYLTFDPSVRSRVTTGVRYGWRKSPGPYDDSSGG